MVDNDDGDDDNVSGPLLNPRTPLPSALWKSAPVVRHEGPQQMVNPRQAGTKDGLASGMMRRLIQREVETEFHSAECHFSKWICP